MCVFRISSQSRNHYLTTNYTYPRFRIQILYMNLKFQWINSEWIHILIIYRRIIFIQFYSILVWNFIFSITIERIININNSEKKMKMKLYWNLYDDIYMKLISISSFYPIVAFFRTKIVSIVESIDRNVILKQ